MEKTKEDLENIKSKLIEHIKTTYSEEKANKFISNLNSMDDENFVKFLKEQKLIKENDECIFCSIIYGDVPSTKIGENDSAIAILDINPASIGHTLILPKEHLENEEKLNQQVKELAQEISTSLEKALLPKRISITPANIMGHQIINLLPIYDNETLDSPRTQETPEGLKELKEKIEKLKKEKIIIPEKEKETKTEEKLEEINEKNTWLPKRFP